jgi:hypothetical protein
MQGGFDFDDGQLVSTLAWRDQGRLSFSYWHVFLEANIMLGCGVKPLMGRSSR